MQIHLLTEEEKLRGATTNARNARAARTRKWLDYEALLDADIKDPMIPALTRAKLIDAQDKVAERLRLLSGAVRPGSRNVSVREIGPNSVQSKRLPVARSTSDYLSAAREAMDAEGAPEADEQSVG